MIVRVISSTGAAASWKHAFSGSPRPSETVLAAVRRCAERDLGIHEFTIAPLLPTLSNHTISAAGGAKEVHPSYLVSANEKPYLAAGLEAQWLTPKELGELARRSPHDYSPLLGLQAAHVPFFGGMPPATRNLALQQERAFG